MSIRVAIVGLGNCASALVQGSHYYSSEKSSSGLISEKIGNYTVKDLEYVLAFDVDERKIGQTIKDGIFLGSNCCTSLSPGIISDLSGRYDGIVHRAPILDGVAEHMRATNALDKERFFVSESRADAFSQQHFIDLLTTHRVDVIVNYLPVGSQHATEFWATCALKAKCQFVNCIPVFIASEPKWAQDFKESKLCVIGDDMKSQFGASILSQAFQELAESRGHRVKVHIQQNSGGNTDFLNMTAGERLKSKKISKENVLKNHGVEPEFFHAGPSDYIRVYGDTKVATFHLELEGFCGSPVKLDARLEVQDSPNSAGIVIDAIRYVKVAHERGHYGALEGPSAFTQKSPPKTLSYAESLEACAKFK